MKKKEARYPRTDPSEIVEEALHMVEEDLYGGAKDARRMMYSIILDHLCYMMLVDGGPTFGLEVLEEGCAGLRNWEKQRGRKEVGPFLTKAQRATMLETPGRYLRQDIECTGPKGWRVTDGYLGLRDLSKAPARRHLMLDDD